jgi:hypothetical protein
MPIAEEEKGLQFKRSYVYTDPRLTLLVCASLVTDTDGNFNLNARYIADGGNRSHPYVGQRLPSFPGRSSGFRINKKFPTKASVQGL